MNRQDFPGQRALEDDKNYHGAARWQHSPAGANIERASADDAVSIRRRSDRGSLLVLPVEVDAT
jgi:hypothetical protein